MFPGETILSGAPGTCPECGQVAAWGVYESGAGWYVGTYCGCGPYTRESGYYPTKESAEHVYLLHAQDEWKRKEGGSA